MAKEGHDAGYDGHTENPLANFSVHFVADLSGDVVDVQGARNQTDEVIDEKHGDEDHINGGDEFYHFPERCAFHGVEEARFLQDHPIGVHT